MRNVFDYVKEMRQQSFSATVVNEVDALALSMLVYTDFSGILDENSDETLSQVNRRFWELHSEAEITAAGAHAKRSPFLLREMADSVRYGEIRLKNYVNAISLVDVKQFAAVTCSLPDGSDFVAYRGTDGTVTGLIEDFKFSFSTTAGQEDAVDYLNLYHRGHERPILLGGHSKGGNLAVYAATYCEVGIQERIERIYSYDGPGFKAEVLGAEEYKRILPRVLSIVPKDCLIGTMMHNRYNTIVTDSERSFIHQHDTFQWHIEDNHFKELPDRSEVSKFFEKIVDNWLYRCDEKKRREILDVLLALIIDNKLVTEDDRKLSARFFYNLILNTPKLSGSDKSLLLSSISAIFVSTSVVSAGVIKEKATRVMKRVRRRIGE